MSLFLVACASQPESLPASELPLLADMYLPAPTSVAVTGDELASPEPPAVEPAARPEAPPAVASESASPTAETDRSILAPQLDRPDVVLLQPLPEPQALPPAQEPLAPARPAPSPPVAETPQALPEQASPEQAAAEAPAGAPPAAVYQLPEAPPSSARIVSPVEAPVAMIEVEAVRGQRFDLRFRGSGWTYLGDEEGREGIRYETRRFENNEAVFTLNPAQDGDYLLRFRRQNPLTQEMESSLVSVRVVPPSAGLSAVRRVDSNGSVDIQVLPAGQQPQAAGPAATPAQTAPAPSPAAAPAQAAAPVAPAATSLTPAAAASDPASAMAEGPGASAVADPTAPVAGDSATAAAPPVAAPSAAAPVAPGRPDHDPQALLRYARDELGANRVQSALAALDRYVELYRSGNDELYFLYALAYEQDTPFRNIRLAHENYRRVRDEYPRSPHRQQAIERINWLERHFFGLR